MPMPTPVHQCESYTCDRCEDTVLCSPTELTRDWKWKRYAKDGALLLCPDCQPRGKAS